MGVSVISEVARLARYGVRMIARPKEVTLAGVKLSLPDGVRGKVLASIYAEKYENLETKLLPKYLKPDDVVVEAGAAIGFVGAICANTVGAENVYMIEANPDLIPVIKKNFSLNGFAEPQTIQGVATAAEGDPVEFRVAEQFWSSSTLDRGQTLSVVKAPPVNLNRQFREKSATVFICDIEGGEFSLLPLLDLSTLRLIVIEVHHKLADAGAGTKLIKGIKNAGFDLKESVNDEVYIFQHREITN